MTHYIAIYALLQWSGPNLQYLQGMPVLKSDPHRPVDAISGDRDQEDISNFSPRHTVSK